MNRTTNFSALGTSIIVHGILLGALATMHYTLDEGPPEIVLETVFDEERQQEEFAKELETDTEIAETQNFMAGGAVSTAVGGDGAPAVNQTQIEESETLQEIDVQVNVSTVTLPGENIIGQDLGIGEVNGEVGAIVEGYGAALSRLTQELIRLMRQRKVLVVWLFDESNSMKDDQQEIASKFHKVYEELGIQTRKDKILKQSDEVLMTAILSFGKGVNELTKKPTTNINEVRAAIDQIRVDESGLENMCNAIIQSVEKYGVMARKQNRQLILVVVSDESPSDTGDDDLRKYGDLELTIKICEKAKAPVYLLGRESIFGYPFARIRWKDPVFNLNHWVWINRGPETARPECLLWNGLHARHDSSPSGFGPYSQVRLCKETGGIFFMLPGEEENLVGRPAAIEARKFQAIAMKEYEPLLLPRKQYEIERGKRDFRQACWNVIVGLNPHMDKKLSMQTSHFSIEPAEFRKQGFAQFEKAAYAMSQLDKALKMLDQVRDDRAKEESQRWRACYDLLYAQCIAYRVRLFQYMLALDEHGQKGEKPKDPKHNRWHIYSQRKYADPNETQFALFKKHFGVKGTREEYIEELAKKRQMATDAFDFVMKEHGGTPWFARAKWDKNRGYGFHFRSHFHDPRYNQVGKRITVPKF
jgi:hypothetical protein